jgi:hypothetical protein
LHDIESHRFLGRQFLESKYLIEIKRVAKKLATESEAAMHQCKTGFHQATPEAKIAILTVAQ